MLAVKKKKRIEISEKKSESARNKRLDASEFAAIIFTAVFLTAGLIAQASLAVFLFQEGGKDGLLRLLADARKLFGF